MSGEAPFLTRPCWDYQDSYIAAVYEYIEENLEPTWHPEILKSRFDEFLEVMRQAETEPLAGMAPATQYWMIVPGVGYAGDLSLRHRLNDSLRRYGGHIGYTIRPSQRGKGYGKLLCKLGIEAARQRGIGAILITCDDDNLASRRIIEANGGRLCDTIDNGREALTRRYWVDCGRQSCV
jgi:predicted acetyltransferase